MAISPRLEFYGSGHLYLVAKSEVNYKGIAGLYYPSYTAHSLPEDQVSDFLEATQHMLRWLDVAVISASYLFKSGSVKAGLTFKSIAIAEGLILHHFDSCRVFAGGKILDNPVWVQTNEDNSLAVSGLWPSGIAENHKGFDDAVSALRAVLSEESTIYLFSGYLVYTK